MGSGPQPPSVTVVADKYANIGWTNNCIPATSCTFNVYRGIVAGGAKGRINPAAIVPSAYRDATSSTPPPAFGVTNFYVVTAVLTSSGVESVPSNEVSATAAQGNGGVPAPSNVNAVLAFFLDILKGVEVAGRFVIHFLA